MTRQQPQISKVVSLLPKLFFIIFIAGFLAVSTPKPTSAATTDCSNVFTPLDSFITQDATANESVYVQVQNTTGVPWQMLAAIHYRETNFSMSNPANGLGIYQDGNTTNVSLTPGPISAQTFYQETLNLGNELQNDYVWRGSVPRDRVALTPNDYDTAVVKDTLFSYNGRAGVYAQQAATYGYNSTTQPYEGSPYVMNRFDCPRVSMGIITQNGGGISGTDTRYGAFTVYARLIGDSYWKSLIGTTGLLIRTSTDPTIYYTEGSEKYPVGSMSMAAEYGLGVPDVRIVQQSEFDAIPVASSPNTPNLSLVEKSSGNDDNGNIYLITNGNRYLISSMTQLANFGFTTSNIGYMPLAELERMPYAGYLSNFVTNSEGFVYEVTNDTLHGIYDSTLLSQLNPSGSISNSTDFALSGIPLGTAILNGNTAMKGPDGRVWLATTNGWYAVTSMDLYNCLGLTSIPNIAFTNQQTTIGTQLGTASCLVQTTGGQNYILDNWRRIPVNPSWGFSNGLQIGDSLITRLPVYNPTTQPVFRTPSSGALYDFENGMKRQIINMNSFNANGYTSNDIFTTTSNLLNTIPTGTYKLGDGMVVQDSSTGILYIIAGSSKWQIPSMTIFYNYGFSTSQIISLDPATLTAYTTAGSVGQQLANSPGATVFDSGIALQISSGLLTAYGFNGTQPTYPAAIASNGSIRQATQYVKFGSSAMLYYMQNGQKHPVYSWDTFTALGGNNSNITGLSANAANLFPTGSNM